MMPKITCTDEQLGLIETCIEAMFRMSMGQMMHGVDTLCDIVGRRLDYEERKGIEHHMRLAIFPELVEKSIGGFSSYGYNNKEIGKGIELCEMYKVLQNYRAKRDGHDDFSVTRCKPFRVSGKPFIVVEP